MSAPVLPSFTCPHCRRPASRHEWDLLAHAHAMDSTLTRVRYHALTLPAGSAARADLMAILGEPYRFPLRPLRCACGEHELWPVAEAGRWSHGIRTVAADAATPDFWDRCELDRGEMLMRVRAARGIGCEYALEAWARWTGEILLVDGCHRWAAASVSRIDTVPVLMEREQG